MRLFDKILVEETNRNLTAIDDIDHIVLSPGAAYQLKEECIQEFELTGVVTIRDIRDNMGINIKIDPLQIEDFRFVLT